MKKQLIAAIAALMLALTLGTLPARADETAPQAETPHTYPQGILFPYSLLDAALAGNIDEYGNINYLKVKDDKNLANFIEAVGTADLKAFPTFDIDVTDPKTGRVTKTVTNRDAELVFWINAYNACVIHTITEHYPVKSVDKIDKFDTEKTHLIAGEKYSFAELRDKIAGFDPRALFALMSGSKGGFLPAKDAYRYSHINASLDAAVRVFVNNPNNVNVSRIQNTVHVNEYFKLINDAFKKVTKSKNSGRWAGIRYVISAYVEKGADQRYLTNGEYQLEFAIVSHELNDNTHK